jgi:hypothetical protein
MHYQKRMPPAMQLPTEPDRVAFQAEDQFQPSFPHCHHKTPLSWIRTVGDTHRFALQGRISGRPTTNWSLPQGSGSCIRPGAGSRLEILLASPPFGYCYAILHACVNNPTSAKGPLSDYTNMRRPDSPVNDIHPSGRHPQDQSKLRYSDHRYQTRVTSLFLPRKPKCIVTHISNVVPVSGRNCATGISSRRCRVDGASGGHLRASYTIGQTSGYEAERKRLSCL